MTDLSTRVPSPRTARDPAHGHGAVAPAGRRIRRTRGLPGGRAVVGALLVTVAAVATFATYLGATAEPSTEYLVATGPIPPGTRFDDLEQVTEAIGSVAMDLGPPVDERAVPAAQLSSLVGRVLVAPLRRGDLVSRTALVDDGSQAGAQTVSFPLRRDHAVGGDLRPGERLDVLATYGSGEAANTAYVLRSVPLVRVTAPDGGPLGSATDVVLTLAVEDPAEVQSLGHAVAVAKVLVARSSSPEAQAAPPPFRVEAHEHG